MKRTIYAGLALMLSGLGLVAFATTADATKPAPEHKVTICHATPPDTAAQGWVSITVDVASVGYQHQGHESEHDADIIPAYAYGDFTFDGKNLSTDFDGALGSDILANGCEKPSTEPSPSPSPSESDTPSPSPSPSDSDTPKPSPTPTHSDTPKPTPSHSHTPNTPPNDDNKQTPNRERNTPVAKELPHTGGVDTGILLVGLALLAGGTLLTVLSRKTRLH